MIRGIDQFFSSGDVDYPNYPSLAEHLERVEIREFSNQLVHQPPPLLAHSKVGAAGFKQVKKFPGNNVKILQSAAYAYTSKVPVILAEVPAAEVHLVDCETSVRLLNWARGQLDRLKKLREMGRRIPDCYRCRSCANDSCPY